MVGRKLKPRAFLGMVALILAGLGLTAGGRGRSATDSGELRIRGGSQTAINAAAPRTTLVISGTCQGTFTVDKSLGLKGGSAAVLDANGGGTTLTVTGRRVILAYLTITGGDSADSAGGILNLSPQLSLSHTTVSGNAGYRGGGIQNQNGVSIARSLITANRAYDLGSGIYNTGGVSLDNSTVSLGAGTGVWNDTAHPGAFWIRDSTINDNSSDQGAGGVENARGSMFIWRSTIANNHATNGAGGAISNHGSLTLGESTITPTTLTAGAGGLVNTGTTTSTATILAGNTRAGIGPLDCTGSIGSTGYNLIGTGNGCSGFISTDIVGTNQAINPRLLGPLGKHGGPTATILPRPPPVQPSTQSHSAPTTQPEPACISALPQAALALQTSEGSPGQRASLRHRISRTLNIGGRLGRMGGPAATSPATERIVNSPAMKSHRKRRWAS